MARYTFNHVVSGNRQITFCNSRYAGKPISARAVCSPDDHYDPEVGEKIAQAKLDLKVQKIRVRLHKENVEYMQKLLDSLREDLLKEQARLDRDSAEKERLIEFIKSYSPTFMSKAD